MSNYPACEELQQGRGHLGSSPGIVPDIPEEYPTQSDDPEYFWPTAAEIRAELLWARFLKQAEIDRFVEHGVKASALYVSGPVVVDQVVFQDNLFEFGRYGGDRSTQKAFIFEVRGADGLTDLAAWGPQGDQLALWLGRGFALGEDQIWFPTLSGGPLRIWRSPLGWLRAYRSGLVILNPRAAYSYLCDVPALAAEDANHRKEIEKMLILPRPRIVVAPSISNSVA
jgi:hypothetical protein